jgi:hypothetical protein
MDLSMSVLDRLYPVEINLDQIERPYFVWRKQRAT